MITTLKDFAAQLPKAELHIHIEGSLEPAMMFELANRNGVSLPYAGVDAIAEAYKFDCLQDFLDLYYQGMSVLLNEQDFHDLTWAYLLRCHEQNVVHCEIFFDPQGHTERGVGFDVFMCGICSALDKAKTELGISSKLILCFLRHLDEKSAFETLQSAEPYLHKIDGVGLDSSEMGHPPHLFRNVFARAGELGLKRVAHAGEEGPPEYVVEALDLLHVDRIDHGNRALEDEALVQRLADEAIPLTVCPQSNLRLAVVKDMSRHPIRQMLALGLKVCVNSDDPAYFGGYMNENFVALIDETGLTREEIIQLTINGFESSFLSDEEIQSHLDRISDMNVQEPFRFSTASRKFMAMFELKYPIVQAPAGGVVTSDLVAAVCNAGCLGGLPLSWADAKTAKKLIASVQSKTAGTFFANFVLNFEPVALSAALKAGVHAIQFSWGMPTTAQVEAIKSSPVFLGVQVTDKESAWQALKLGADYLVCQGLEAGGHVHSSRPLGDALERVLAVAGDVPVIAAGGVATGNDIHRLLLAGAAGVVMGTRFVATRESGAHQQYKESLVNAQSEDTVFTTCMNKGWDGATHRILRNSTFTEWEKFGCPQAGSRPGEYDIIASYGGAEGDEYTIERYSIDSPGHSMSGDLEALANYAGTGVDNINDIPSVAELVTRIWKEFECCY